jgi:hypothetical protein
MSAAPLTSTPPGRSAQKLGQTRCTGVRLVPIWSLTRWLVSGWWRSVAHVMTASSISAGNGGGYARYLESKTIAPEQGDYYLTPDGEPTQAPGRWLMSPETRAKLGIEGGAGRRSGWPLSLLRLSTGIRSRVECWLVILLTHSFIRMSWCGQRFLHGLAIVSLHA